MKYKGIELKQGNDSEAELLVAVEITKEFDAESELEEMVEEVEERILTAFADFSEEVYIEIVMDNLLNVRCDAITFDINGVVLLCEIYWKVSGLDMEGVKVYVAVHVDDEWFQREDGTEYNEDVVTLDEFLENAEYPVYGKDVCIGQLEEKGSTGYFMVRRDTVEEE